MAKGSKPAVQKRSRQTRDAIVEALDRLLRSKDFADIGVTELAEEAGVSPGSIYRRFEGGLVPVLFELCRDRIAARAADQNARIETDASADLRATLRRAADAVWDQLSADAHIYRAAYVHSRLRPDLVGGPWEELEAASLAGFRAIIDAHADEVRRADLDTAAAMTAYYFNTMFIPRGLFADLSPDWPGLPDGAAFAREAADFAYGYLVTPEG